MKRYLIAFIFVLFTLLTAITIYLYDNSRQEFQLEERIGAEIDEPRIFTKEELGTFNGKSGNKCYIGLDGFVFEITDSSLWVEGEHVTSEGQAFCGLDLTEVISQSPHGRSKLSNNPKVQVVGELQK